MLWFVAPSYFRVPSVQHYLVADPDTRVVIHRARAGTTTW
jgi:hypothetical protein